MKTNSKCRGITTVKLIAGRYEIIRDKDDYGNKRYTIVDRNGYIGRTRIGTRGTYLDALGCVREYKYAGIKTQAKKRI